LPGSGHEVARGQAPLVADLVPVKPSAQTLLHIGSHGLFGACMCRAHPPMRSTVLDLPDAVEQSRQLAQAAQHLSLLRQATRPATSTVGERAS
jgi:hypothetical protein